MVIKLSEKQKITVMNSDDLYEVMRQILLRENKIDQDQEHFWVEWKQWKATVPFLVLIV